MFVFVFYHEYVELGPLLYGISLVSLLLFKHKNMWIGIYFYPLCAYNDDGDDATAVILTANATFYFFGSTHAGRTDSHSRCVRLNEFIKHGFDNECDGRWKQRKIIVFD